MRHSWIIAVTPEPDAISRRVSVGWSARSCRLGDGRTVLIAATPDVLIREHGDLFEILPLPGIVIASVDTENERVFAYRSILSVPEVYWINSPALLLLGSSIAVLLPFIRLPKISEQSLVDHHLFRYVPGARTALEDVFSLLPGHELQWTSRTQAAVVQRERLYNRAIEEPEPVGVVSARDQINALVRAVTPAVKDTQPEERALLLSGGIDSTLLQIALDLAGGASPRQSRSYVMEDTPSWSGERDYCSEAVRILRTQHELTTIRSAEFPKLLTDSLATLGRPFGHEPLPVVLGLLRALGRGDATILWSGQGADGIYGFSIAEMMCRRQRYAHIPSPVLRALGVALEPFWPTKADGARKTLQYLSTYRDDTSPEHPTNIQARYCDINTVTAWFGERAIVQTLANRRNLASLLVKPVMECEVERVHMVDLFSEALYAASMNLQLGAAVGCTVLHPYLDQEVVNAALRVDPLQRYYHDGRTKPLLKLALQEHTGLNFVSRVKRGGGFYADLCAWMRDGVLADMVRSIERPGYADRKSFHDKIDNPDWTTWNLLLMDLYVRHLRTISERN